MTSRARITGSLKRLSAGISRLETHYQNALDSRTAVHSLLKKTSDDLMLRYWIIFEYSGTAMAILEEDGTISMVNSLVEQITGYTQNEVVYRRNFLDFIPEDARGTVAEYHRKRREGNEQIPHLYETRIIHKDGRQLDIIINAALLPGTKQSVISLLDITQRKRAEKDLADSRSMLQLVLDTIPTRVFWKDRNSVYLGCNKPLALDSGYSHPEDLVGKTDFETASADLADRFRADDREVMESGSSKLNYEEPQIKPDGSRAWLRTSKVPLRDPDGQVIGILGTYEDITERKHAEEALRESEARFRMLAETSNAAIYVFSQKILYANKAAEELTGYSRQELMAMDFWDFIHPESRDLVRDRGLRRQQGEIVPPHYEFRILRKDGTERWVDASTALIQIEGAPNTNISVHIDITERKLLENEQEFHAQELRRYAAILRQTNDKLNLLNNITRHDILNQLTVLTADLDLVTARFPDPALQKYLLREMQTVETIESLIRFTKDYQDIGVQSPRWIELRQTILSVEKTLDLSAIRVTVDFDTLEVYADPLIEKVIYTFFDNAGSHGKSVTHITFSAIRHDNGLIFAYEDNGEGVPAGQKEAIFTRKYFQHSGLGLFLSREILAITGLTIRETGEPGKGARFEILVPPGSFRM